jgi:hypothetical protein
MIHILALLARAGHGKTTVAGFLRDRYNAQIVSLAGPLKRCAQKVMGFSAEQLYGTQKEIVDPRYGFSPRWFLQRLGTEGLRQEFGPDVHINALLRKIEEDDAKSDAHGVYVIDDVRFLNEVEAIVRQDNFHGACLKIVCTDAPELGKHASEQEIDTIPRGLLAATVTSSRTLGVEDLKQKVEQALRAAPRLAPITRALDALRTRRAA